MEKRKNLCAMIPEELHGRVKQEQEALALTLAQYVEMVLEEHFKKGGKEMANGDKDAGIPGIGGVVRTGKGIPGRASGTEPEGVCDRSDHEGTGTVRGRSGWRK